MDLDAHIVHLQAQHPPCLQLMGIHNRFQVAQLSLLTLQIISRLEVSQTTKLQKSCDVSGGAKKKKHLNLIEFGLNCLDARPAIPSHTDSEAFNSQHLVIDCFLSPWLTVRIPTSGYRYLKAAKTEPHNIDIQPSNDTNFPRTTSQQTSENTLHKAAHWHLQAVGNWLHW